ncbi:MarR family transcriptional regulator [Salicibibacter cibarius]|uniref:MarR family transcriptional regulator n=1 Tax=Salicibibacter cibarius TaxID=2743000 RepID=A0A7T6Z6R8_9BACI|nr:MarR family transcriptional regulator [Salicibibacter cibarius]QQK77697.1 MarR family transcriptional regulator [Salicibibacter cibarius]
MNQSLSEAINRNWTEIYYHLHYEHQEPITHQAIRMLQYLDFNGKATVGELSNFLSVSHNTASEHVKRLIQKSWVAKIRSTEDERRVHVVITEDGKKILSRNTQLNEEKLANILNSLTKEEADTIKNAFAILSWEAKACSPQ